MKRDVVAPVLKAKIPIPAASYRVFRDFCRNTSNFGIALSQNKCLSFKMNHTHYMNIAIQEAGKARIKGEVPVGAVLVAPGEQILSTSHNQPITLSDPTAHAEILVLREAAAKIKNYRLLSTVLYVTVEPCVMCMGALIHARVSTLVFGTKDSKWGAAGSLYNFAQDTRLNHRPQVIGGICQDTCRQIMQNFFKNKRLPKIG